MDKITHEGSLEFSSYGDRLQYLQKAIVGHKSPRSFSNPFYKSPEWQTLRDEIISRDGGWDLGVKGVKIEGPVYVHHINPIEEEDLENMTNKVMDPNNLITCSHDTHMKIHYGQRIESYIERRPGDNKLW